MLNTKTAKFILIIGVSAAALVGCSVSNQNKVTPYSFNSAKIELAQTGSIQGTTTIYIKGDKTLRETHATKNIQGPQGKVDNLYLDLGEKIYQIDLNTKTGLVTQNPFYNDLKNLSPDKRMDFQKRTILGLKADSEEPKPTAQKDIAGQKCDLYKIQNITEACIWNGLTIYEKTSIPEINLESNSVATKIEINPDIPDSTFTVPADVTIKDSSTP